MQAIAIEALQSLSGRLIVLGLLHSLWISLCTASAVALWFQVRPRLSHRVRYRVLAIAFLFVATVPIVFTALHHALLIRHAGIAATIEVIAVSGGTAQFDENRPFGDTKKMTPFVSQAPSSTRYNSTLSVALSHSVDAVQGVWPFLLVAWGAGVLTCAGLLALGTSAQCLDGLEGQSTRCVYPARSGRRNWHGGHD